MLYYTSGVGDYASADQSRSCKAVFSPFYRRTPDVKALAECPEEKLMKLWEGLGYYNRVRNMQSAAQVRLSQNIGGVLPASYDELLALKGIGSYTAGAIASIAYDIPVPAVDGNVLRVFRGSPKTVRIS